MCCLRGQFDYGDRAAENPETLAVFLARAMDLRLQPLRIGICDNTSAPLFRAGTNPLRLKLLFIDVLEQLSIKKPSAIHVKFEKMK